MSNRNLTLVVRGKQTVDGAGVHLRRVLSIKTIRDFDPFLMLDGFDSTNPDDYTAGFPWHPHRGIETVTYLLSGEIDHGDSLGNSGVIGDLQCQWMTAGSGIIHQEMPQASPRMLGCQLWVNLARKDKMTRPAYRDIQSEHVPIIEETDAIVRVLSGHYNGTPGAIIGEYIPVQYLDVELKAGTAWQYNQTPNDETLFLYLLDGTLAAEDGKSPFEEKACAMLFTSSSSADDQADTVSVKAGDAGARFLLVAAKPLKEPVAWGGPIVMNTQAELDEAFDELRSKTFIRHPNPTNRG